MSRMLKRFLLAGALPLLFQACDPAAPADAPQTVSPLLQCRGTPGYTQSWPEILHGLDQSGVVYCASPPGADVPRSWTGNDVTGDSLDTVRIHQVVLDAQCRFLEDRDDTLTLPARATGFSGVIIWGGRLQDGSAAPTGEYFVNTIREWPDGRKDTTWEKTGYVRTACGTVSRVLGNGPSLSSPLR